MIDSPQEKISGVGAGIDDDGALLVKTLSEGIRRVMSGSVVMAGIRDSEI